jgi:thioredoxin reductase (NADPH)
MAAPAPLTETPDRTGAFPRLTDEQIETLSEHGERRPTRSGEVLFREGDRSYDFFVILEGLVAIVEGYGNEERVLGVHGPRRFLGELNLLTGQASFLTAVVREPGEVLAVPVERMRELVVRDPSLGDVILRAFLLRRSILIEIAAGFRIVGSRYSPDTRRLREFAARNRLPHRWIDLEEDSDAEALLRALQVSPEETPVVVLSDRVLRNPSNAELARAIGLKAPRPHEHVCDLVVVGSGPAGLAAAVYGASDGLDTFAVDSVATGGQAETTSLIENYLGFPSGISGIELAERATIQARKFGADITVPVAAVSLRRNGGDYIVGLEDGESLSGRAVVIATGAHYRRLPVPGLEEFEGTSIYYAATQVEALVCGGDPVAVVGGGNSGGQAAVFLSRTAAQVWLVVRESELGEYMSRYLVDQVERNPRIKVLLHSEVRELLGEGGALREIVVEDTQAGERHTLPARALFVFIGADPCTPWLAGQLALDDNGFILTGPAVAAGDREPALLETSWDGVFAAGDVRSGSARRVAAAVGEGAMAVRLAYQHLERRGQVP